MSDLETSRGTNPRPRPRAVVVEAETSPLSRLLVYGVLLAVILFGAGAVHHWQAEQARRAQAAQELAAQREAAEFARRRREEDARRDTLRRQQARDAQINERLLQIESRKADKKGDGATPAAEMPASDARR